jgi:hypothetical protein
MIILKEPFIISGIGATCDSVITSIFKMVAFPFYLQSGKKGKVRWVGDNSHVVFGQKFAGEKGSVKWCVVVIQQPVILLPKFRVKSS